MYPEMVSGSYSRVDDLRRAAERYRIVRAARRALREKRHPVLTGR